VPCVGIERNWRRLCAAAHRGLEFMFEAQVEVRQFGTATYAAFAGNELCSLGVLAVFPIRPIHEIGWHASYAMRRDERPSRPMRLVMANKCSSTRLTGETGGLLRGIASRNRL